MPRVVYYMCIKCKGEVNEEEFDENGWRACPRCNWSFFKKKEVELAEVKCYRCHKEIGQEEKVCPFCSWPAQTQG